VKREVAECILAILREQGVATWMVERVYEGRVRF
jgi:hypothetical protein